MNLHSYFSKLGQRGGRARSEKKLSASMENLRKSRNWKRHVENAERGESSCRNECEVASLAHSSVPRDLAKQEILDFYRNAQGSAFYRDISDKLQLDLKLVAELSEELEKEGFLE